MIPKVLLELFFYESLIGTVSQHKDLVDLWDVLKKNFNARDQ